MVLPWSAFPKFVIDVKGEVGLTLRATASPPACGLGMKPKGHSLGGSRSAGVLGVY